MLAQAQHAAQHDVLTGLANRALFNAIVRQQLLLCARTGARLCLLFIDLDNFKQVNDRYGHLPGDELLRAVADRLRWSMRVSDIAARIGGDEFAVALIGVDVAVAKTIAEKLVRSLSEPYALSCGDVAMSASIGIASYPECGSTSETLLERADAAMYQAKIEGRRRYVAAVPARSD